MTKRKLKGYVLPTFFLISLSVILISTFVISKNLKKPAATDETDYVMNSLIDSVEPVVKEEKKSFIAPYDGNVKISNNFYNINATEEEQENSLLYYENTYLKNSGVVYSSNEEFDIVASNDGTVLEIKQDDILNTVVYIKHEDNTTTIYYGLKDVTLKENDQVEKGNMIGKSTNNKFCTEENSILFEIKQDGKSINPEEFLQNQN